MASSKKDQVVSFLGVITLAVVLPSLLKGVNKVSRYFVGAEGRLSAITVDTNRPLGPMPNPWKGLAQGGDRLLTFLDGIETQVRQIQPQYIRIDHIYDGFDVVKNNAGKIEFNWEKLDRLVNKIQATGAKPFFSLSYMPPAIAKTDIVSEPVNWGWWSFVVQKTIEHYSGEMGIDGIYYEVWNEPDLFGGWKIGGAKDYKQLYSYASRGAQNATGVKTFKLGGPATTGLYKNWIDQFFPFILQNKLRLDFFSWHRYDLSLAKYSEDVANVDKWIESHPYFTKVEKIVSEIGPSSQAAGVNDTKLGAAHLIATTRELMYKIKYGFSFSIIGDWGIIGKPRQKALTMLSRLGDNRLSVSGEGTWVRAIGAKKDEVYQVLVVNYDPKEIHAERVPISFNNLVAGEYLLRQINLEGRETITQVATTEAVLQQNLIMAPNSVILMELTLNRPGE